MKDAYTGLCRAVATGTPTQSAYSSSNVPRNIGKAECGLPDCGCAAFRRDLGQPPQNCVMVTLLLPGCRAD